MSCDKNMTFEECELAVLRSAVDKMEKKTGRKKINDPDIKEIIRIVEDFLKLSKRVCYGGTAINNILPLQDQFYDKTTELPDYDFFSPEPLKDAKKLADIYYEKGFTEVEAKSGMHAGTFKVYVNFLPIADITYLVPELYKNIHKKAISVANIYYCPPNYLRMAMYLELSRPDGDVSRWEKVLKRLTLLNKHYPMKGKNCRVEDIQRLFQYGTKKDLMKGGNRKSMEDYEDEEDFLENIEEKIFYTVRDVLMGQGCVFFGAYANRMYLKTLKYLRKKKVPRVPDFDVLSDDPETTARILQERLQDLDLKKVNVKKKPGVGEIIAPHYEVSVGPETVAFIYEPLACHSYNTIDLGPHKLRIATLDTMLSFYLAFIYVNRPYYDANRILCMSKFLFKVQQKNRLSQKGLLRRFSPDCYGVQLTKEKMREEKAEKHRELKDKKGTREYDWYFLRYIPGELDGDYIPPKKKKRKKRKKKTKKKRKTKKGILSRLGFGGRKRKTKKKRKR
tara:strand:- start:2566 stop:4080 length:1515 start_codon:yes stop_codon:yes gene_type:complete